MNCLANFCKICCRNNVALTLTKNPTYAMSTQSRFPALLEPRRLAPIVTRCMSSEDNTGDNMKDLFSDIQLPEQIVSDDQFQFDVADSEVNATQALPGLMLSRILIPTEETHEAMVDGQKYSELPIAHIHASYNNTIINITDHTGANYISRCSPGIVGYRGAKRKTNVAAHSAALEAGKRAIRKGVTHVRVALKGIGRGRLAACKGLELSGIEIVSLTDVSQVNWGSQMPRKARN